MTKLERLMHWLETEHGMRKEVQFRGVSGSRRFRCDAGMPEQKVCVDYHGWGSGAAHRARGKQSGDHEKVSELSLCGWTYVICDAISIDSGKCMTYVDMAMGVQDRACPEQRGFSA